MNLIEKDQLRLLVKEYPIHHVLDALQEAIENHMDELVDADMSSSSAIRELSRVAHHLSIFPRE